MRGAPISELKFFKCMTCGNVVWKVVDGGGELVCCAEPMVELVPGTSDGVAEKHVPHLTVEGDRLAVNVGELDHPMAPEHFICFVLLDCGGEKAEVKFLEPGDAPRAVFRKPPAPATIYEYCNLHGLWKAEFAS